MDFNVLIKDLRIKVDKSINEVAREIGVSPATVLRWESGEIKNMRRDKLVALARSLNVDPVVLMGAIPYDPNAAPTRESVTAMLEKMLHDTGYLRDGETLTPELLNSIGIAVQTAIELYRKQHQ